jgi:hypothetical protein
MTKKLKPLITELEWYQELVEELRAIIVETRFNSTVELLRGKWELGKRITEEELNFQRAGYGDRMVETIAKDLGISPVHLWKCIQFYKKFPEKTFEEVLQKLPGGKAISWYKVSTLYLPKHKEEVKKEKDLEELQKNCPHEKLKCTKCKKEFDWFELLQWVEEQKRKM